VTYFQIAPKSSKEIVPLCWRSNIPVVVHNSKWNISTKGYKIIINVSHTAFKHIPIISLTVSELNGAHVPLDRADCSSWAVIAPLLSLSTLKISINIF
jgi:hypothetical protein